MHTVLRGGGAVLSLYFIAAIAALFMVTRPLPAAAELREMSGAQMAEITGTGFSSFTVVGDTVRADFAISAATYTTIDSLKMGYWDNGTGAKGWDQNWQGVSIGTLAADMTLSGFFIEATFQNISDPVNRRLTSAFFGFSQATGNLSADFQSISRIGDTPRANLGQSTFIFNSSELSVSLQLDGPNKGIWVRFGDGTTRQ